MSFLDSLFCCNDDSPLPAPQRPSEKVPIHRFPHQYKPQSNSFRRNGIGVYTYDNGDQYDGEWMEGRRHGRGKIIYKNGDFFLGEWVMDKKGGRGFHVFANMDKYEGEWKNDLMDGNGKLTYASGSYYEGEFNQGKKDGKGIFYNSENKKKYKESYKSGDLVHKQLIKTHEMSPTKHSKKNIEFERPKLTQEDVETYVESHPQVHEVNAGEMLYYYGICRIKGREFFKTDPKTWTVEQVVDWSKTVGITQSCEDLLKKHKISGKILLYLKNEELRKDLKMALGDMKKIMGAIDHLKRHFFLKEKEHKEHKDRDKDRERQKEKEKDKEKEKEGRNLVGPSRLRRKSLTTFYSGKVQNLPLEAHNPIFEENDQNEKEEEDSPCTAKKMESPRKNVTHTYFNYTTEQLNYNHTLGIDQHLYESENTDLMMHYNESQTKNDELMNLISEVDEKELSLHEPPFSRRMGSKKPSDEVKDSGDNQDTEKEPKDRSSASQETSSSSSSEEQSPKKHRKSREIKTIEMRQLFEYLRNHHISMNFLIPDNQITHLEPIGEGGYGKVFKAKWLSNPVAVKTYMKSGRLRKKNLENFLKEVKILNDLRHPNIVLYMGMCIQINRYSLVTEYLQWGSLFDMLHKKKYHFDDQRIFNIVEDMALGMVYLHAKDVLHRDLKSSNVLMDEDCNVKLCDFGLSEMHAKTKAKNTKTRIGTYQWMAPEVLRKQKYGFPSDVYSFGMIVWQILTEQIPYETLSMSQIVGTVGYDEQYLIQRPHRGQDYLVEIMYDCLRYNPKDRPTFKDIQERLQIYKKQSSQADDHEGGKYGDLNQDSS